MVKVIFASVLTVASVYAKDLGVHGHTFAIEEDDLLDVIQQRLHNLKGSGALEQKELEFKKRATHQALNPKPLGHLKTAQQNRTFYYDPTFFLTADLSDHKGVVFHKKGTIINPLAIKKLNQTLIFFSADDPKQLAWVQQKIKGDGLPFKLILTAGSPLQVEPQVGKECYFDQGGTLTKKLGILAVPALVTQEGLRLRIDEIVPRLNTGAANE